MQKLLTILLAVLTVLFSWVSGRGGGRENSARGDHNHDFRTMERAGVRVSVDADLVRAPGSVTVSVERDAGFEGVELVSVIFYSSDARQYLTLELAPGVGAMDQLTGKLAVSDFEKSGEYGLYSVSFQLEGGQWLLYSGTGDEEQETVAHFTVESGPGEDNEAPELLSLRLGKRAAAAPDSMTVRITARDRRSGIVNILMMFENSALEGADSVWLEVLSLDSADPACEEYQKQIAVTKYRMGGTYTLKMVNLSDAAGNQRTYEAGDAPLTEELSFTVANTRGTVALFPFESEELARSIRDSPQDGTLFCSSNMLHTLNPAVWKALAGTRRTLALGAGGVSAPVQWEISAADVSPSAGEMNVDVIDLWPQADNRDGAATMSMRLRHSGALPVRAILRVKMDEEMRGYLGVDRVYIYHEDPATGALDLAAAGLRPVADGYLEFPVTQGDRYLFCAGALEEEIVN